LISFYIRLVDGPFVVGWQRQAVALILKLSSEDFKVVQEQAVVFSASECKFEVVEDDRT
jgi:hypothetical protein